jgi:type II restriction enzyme
LPEANYVATAKQVLGRWGETLVAKKFACPRCKRFFTLRRLPPNFKCADIICDFCGYLAQVKSATVSNVWKVPRVVLGAAWGPQRDRMKAGIYFPLFLVLRNGRDVAVYYLPTDFQKPQLFKKRLPLSARARRAGWQGFTYQLSSLEKDAIVRIYPLRDAAGAK